MDAIIFGITVFIGWTLFDFVREKQFKKELIISSIIIGIVAALGWWLLGLFLN